jgi:hypothetical protein
MTETGIQPMHSSSRILIAWFHNGKNIMQDLMLVYTLFVDDPLTNYIILHNLNRKKQ